MTSNPRSSSGGPTAASFDECGFRPADAPCLCGWDAAQDAASLPRITSRSHHTGNDPYGPTGRAMGKLIVTHLTGLLPRRSK